MARSVGVRDAMGRHRGLGPDAVADRREGQPQERVRIQAPGPLRFRRRGLPQRLRARPLSEVRLRLRPTLRPRTGRRPEVQVPRVSPDVHAVCV